MVLDASYTLGLVLSDEDAPGADEVTARILAAEAVTPVLWRFEIGNALLAAMRRGRIGPETVDAVLADLALLPVATDAEGTARAWGDTRLLAARHGLTVYDAAYLELAVRLRAPLATLDAALARAAQAEKLGVLGAA